MSFIMAESSSPDMSKYFEWFKSDYSLTEAALIAVLGIVFVIAVLLVLIGLLMLFNVIFRAIEKKTVKQPAAVAPAEVAPSASEDEETVAAIVAAVSCILQEESEDGQPVPFTVRRIKQVDKLKSKKY